MAHIALHPESGRTFDAFAWPGGYPLVYLEQDPHQPYESEVACPDCATQHYYDWLSWALNTPAEDDTNIYGDWEPAYVPITFQVHYEGPNEICSECNAEIESAYGDPDSETCDQCIASMINGVFCHEHGCPNQHRKQKAVDF